MQVRPEPEHRELARSRGIEERPGELLKKFVERCRAAGLSQEELERAAQPRPYHFDETKSLAAAVQTDWHYFRVAQYLRLSRRAMSLAGLELISATPTSRLNSFFPYRPAEELLEELLQDVGNPARESTRGQYAQGQAATANATEFMRDFRPHNWPAADRASVVAKAPPELTLEDSRAAAAQANFRKTHARQVLAELPEVAVGLDEIG
jgi:hypothetical protein